MAGILALYCYTTSRSCRVGSQYLPACFPWSCIYAIPFAHIFLLLPSQDSLSFSTFSLEPWINGFSSTEPYHITPLWREVFLVLNPIAFWGWIQALATIEQVTYVFSFLIPKMQIMQPENAHGRKLACIFLIKISQPKEAAFCMFPAIGHSGKDKTTETVKTPVATRGWGREGWISRAQRIYTAVKILCMVL